LRRLPADDRDRPHDLSGSRHVIGQSRPGGMARSARRVANRGSPVPWLPCASTGSIGEPEEGRDQGRVIDAVIAPGNPERHRGPAGDDDEPPLRRHAHPANRA
jgi:hypothetical protein